MRWFVEVCRVGESEAIAKYCVEAKQWRLALEEALRLRGNSSPMSEFSIELMDEGYRAVDPALQVGYIVNKAPRDTPLSPGATPHPSSAPPAPNGGQANGARTSSVKPEPAAGESRAPVTKSEPAPNQRDSTRPATPRESNVRVSEQSARKLDSKPPRFGSVASRPPPAESQPLSSQLISVREREPTPESPITYREAAYSASEELSNESVRNVLTARFQELKAQIADKPRGKLIQIAVFDHVFLQKPLRPPLGTLTWKDWRGDPVIRVGSELSSKSVRPSSSETASAATSYAPPSSGVSSSSVSSSGAPASVKHSMPPPGWVATVPVGESKPPQPVETPRPAQASESVQTSQPARTPAPAEAAKSQPAATSSSAAPAEASPATPPPGDGARPSTPPASRSPIVVVPPSAPPRSVQPGEIDVASVVVADADRSAPVGADASKAAQIDTIPPAKAVAEKTVTDKGRKLEAAATGEAPKSRRSDDLIGELFETMHELHFMADVVSGADFVLKVLEKTLPSEVVVVHVFDINARSFVAVRVRGPNSDKLMMYRTPDSDLFVDEVMHRESAVSIPDASQEEHFQNGRWQLMGLVPKNVLCGGVHQGGRYLGLLELANPTRGGPYQPNEINALDYICDQFAEFLANRPIVLDPDVVLRNS